jgi:hypothetical protein
VEAFAGIDVAFAKRKRLPVCLCVWNDRRLIPLPLAAGDAPAPPRGYGNVASIDPSTVALFADETALYLRLLEKHFGVSIRRIAIDAPSDPRPESLRRRLAETAMDQQHISCFATPSASEFETIRVKVRNYLTAGGLESRLPHANQLWMFVALAPNSDGSWAESVLYTFTGGRDGADPAEALTFDAAGNLYGATPIGTYDQTCGMHSSSSIRPV